MPMNLMAISLGLSVIGIFFNPTRAEETASEAAAKLRALYFARTFEAAAAEGKNLVAQFPDSPQTRAWYVLSLARSDREKEAVAEADAMVASSKENPWSWFALAGSLNFLSERGAEALAASEQALAMLPENEDAIWMRAETLVRQRKYNDAVAFVDSHREKVKNSAELLAAKANALYHASQQPRTLDQAKSNAALSAIEEARNLDAKNVTARLLSGSFLVGLRRSAEAVPFLKQALELSPDATGPHTLLWQAVMERADLTAEKKSAEVEADMAAFLERRGSFPGAVFAVATYARQFKLATRQREAEDRLLRDFPNEPSVE